MAANHDGLVSLTYTLVHKIYDIAHKICDLVHHLPDHIAEFHAALDALEHQGTIGIDDRQLLLEKLLHAMAILDTEHPDLSERLQQLVIGTLYKDLPHPATAFLSAIPNDFQAIKSDRTYAYRPADGSNYNTQDPTLGKAGYPYARSVPSSHCTSDWAFPDPKVVFDALLKRDKDTFEPHPGGISSLFFAFADLVIHDIFYTSADELTNLTSSYLDLSILYGKSEAQVDSVRRKDGTGRLWNDVFADKRILFMPPAACALLVLLSRNHNYVAQKILDINEHGNFLNPPPSDAQARKVQDDEIFERARLVNCGLFVHIILGDYVGAILGLVRDGYSWRLDPLMPARDISRGILPRGEGNVVAIEFNLLYTWHATLSRQDTEWTTGALAHLGSSGMTPDKFRQLVNLGPKEDVKKWNFGGLKRTESGSFKDVELANIIHNAIEQRAGAFKARGVPEALRFVEVMIIERARKWGTCTLNEFRKFIGLKPYSSFEQWNPDKEIAAAAAALYHNVDNLELYVGLQAEETKEPTEGAGLCPGYTISRAILSDAVCLSRGDRFLTTDFTPTNLTLWGYQDCQYDRKDGSYGGLLTKLLYRTLPNFFPAGSAYAHFPFLEPSWMHDRMTRHNNKAVYEYTWTRPPAVHEPKVVEQYGEVADVLSNSAFTPESEDRLYKVFGSLVSGSGSEELAKKELIQEIKAASRGIFGKNPAEYFAKKTSELIDNKTLKFGGKKQIDIVQDVINLLPVLWTRDNNIVQVQETPGAFADVGRYVYNNDGPVNDWHLHLDAQEFVNEAISRQSSKAEVTTAIAAIITAPFFSKALAQIVDYYISGDMQKERAEIVKLAKENETANVMTYVKKALRLSPVISGIKGTRSNGSGESAENVYVNIAKANLDSPDAPVITGFENIGFFTERFFEEAVSAVLSVIFDLGNIERVGKHGLHPFTEMFLGARKVQYTTGEGQVTPLPQSMMIELL
ncbi:hypothetical protein APHAL10511_000235 [Amanita phalloides]|nr:hypothetical protein APHAL10511_000235 [Amanita phalloides]